MGDFSFRLRRLSNFLGEGEMLWIAVCTIIGVALVLYALMDIAKREDRMMRRIERSANPFSDVTVTRGR